ncbi:glycosyltransferase 87 family protein [Paractinoplanes rishiriensis]|uniref:Membrane protein n=1 Tax=Paractinoplanes rishiriensis TaxID=1050105 RepID=A0A919JVX4_9ACTN|nr:glycosyltransferase 87 family protein [Actinoplanes rishiriensis]GIE95818.1 membrane protein [Actinoplanes rishiriensis]
MTRRLTVVSGAAVMVAVFLVTVPTFRHFFDLGVYRGAVRYWLLDGGALYDFRYQDSEYGFTYPPFAALVLSPLAAMSWPIAIGAGLVVNAGCVALLLRWFLVPILHRHGWPLWTPVALAFLAVLVFEPARDTFSYGQVNLLLLVLVCGDLRNRRCPGVGIGLAAAIKLTPAVFIGYLLLSRQYRAAATGTAAGATAIAFLLAPDASRVFWTSAVWDTGRIGQPFQVSNQSLRGVLARLDVPGIWWIVAVALVVAAWCWWVRTRRPDQLAGFAVTGAVGCLISPVTWVHHLVWLLPGIFLLLDHAISNPDPVRRKRRLAGLAAGVTVLSSSLVWVWWADPHGWAAFPGGNAYVWLTFLLLGVLVTGNCHTHPARCAHCQRRDHTDDHRTGHRDQRSGENIR